MNDDKIIVKAKIDKTPVFNEAIAKDLDEFKNEISIFLTYGKFLYMMITWNFGMGAST